VKGLPCDFGWRLDVGQVGGYARGVDDIVEGEFGDEGALFQQEGKGLADTT
jgi:hypothetical protein